MHSSRTLRAQGLNLQPLVDFITRSYVMLAAARLTGRSIRTRSFVPIQRHALARYAQNAPSHDEPEYVKRIRADLDQLKLMDKAQLSVTYDAYDKIEQRVRQNTPTARLETAGPREYIVSTGVQSIRLDVLEQLPLLKAHLQDLQSEPYMEYDFDFDNIVLSDRELADLDLQTRDLRDRLRRDAGTLGKYIDIMVEGSKRVKKGSRFDLDKFLNEKIASIQSEEAGVTYSDKTERPSWRPRIKQGEKRLTLQPDQKPTELRKSAKGDVKVNQSKNNQFKADQFKKKESASDDSAWTDHDALLKGDSQGFGDSPSDL